jgi:hypothetical protein
VQGCQIFLGPNIPKWEKYTKLPQTIPNCHKLCQMAMKYSKLSYNLKKTKHFPFQGPPKFTQIRIFGLKINHLATLGWEWGEIKTG